MPNAPVRNEEIEARLGMIFRIPSRIRQRIVEHSGIETRHYALDARGVPTHSNAELAARAAHAAVERGGYGISDIDLLCAATGSPDLLVPGFASMVHGLLPQIGPTEILSPVGGCSAGMSGLSHAYAQVALGRRRCAVSIGSERASALLRAEHHEESLEPGGQLCFDAEFLRWMLSDGAGAVILAPAAARAGISLRIDWIEVISHAHSHPVGTYLGCKTHEPAASWTDVPPVTAARRGYMALRQDVRNVKKVLALLCSDFCRLVDSGRVQLEAIDHFLVHCASRCERDAARKLLAGAGKEVPEERWFTNLCTRGNTGNAAIYLMLEQLLNEHMLSPGETVVCLVPDAGRYTTSFMQLSAVAAGSR